MIGKVVNVLESEVGFKVDLRWRKVLVLLLDDNDDWVRLKLALMIMIEMTLGLDRWPNVGQTEVLVGFMKPNEGEVTKLRVVFAEVVFADVDVDVIAI